MDVDTDSATDADTSPTGFTVTTERTRLGEVAAGLTLVAFTAVAGVPGVAVGVLVAATSLLSPTFGFAIGQVAVVTLVGDGLIAVTAVEAGLVGILLANGSSRQRVLRGFAGVLTGALVGGSLTWANAGSLIGRPATSPVVGLPTAGAVVVGTFVLATYGLHRYKLVALGLVHRSSKGSESRE